MGNENQWGLLSCLGDYKSPLGTRSCMWHQGNAKQSSKSQTYTWLFSHDVFNYFVANSLCQWLRGPSTHVCESYYCSFMFVSLLTSSFYSLVMLILLFSHNTNTTRKFFFPSSTVYYIMVIVLVESPSELENQIVIVQKKKQGTRTCHTPQWPSPPSTLNEG